MFIRNKKLHPLRTDAKQRNNEKYLVRVICVMLIACFGQGNELTTNCSQLKLKATDGQCRWDGWRTSLRWLWESRAGRRSTTFTTCVGTVGTGRRTRKASALYIGNRGRILYGLSPYRTLSGRKRMGEEQV